MRSIVPLCLLIWLCACSIIQSTRIEQAVADALKKDPRTAQYQFEVSRQDDGSILITGKVAGNEEVDAVTEIAKSVPGVKTVVNRCSVEEPGSNLMQDETVNTPFL